MNHWKEFLFNVSGWKTGRKIIVIESDDWGSIRLTSKGQYLDLLRKGLVKEYSKYDTLDILESREDMLLLFDLLAGIRNSDGQNPCMTFNTVMGNPDFDKISGSGFVNFYHEHFFDSYRRYYGEDLESLWRSAMNENLIKPQYHCREHLNVGLWLKDLRSGRREVTLAFEGGFFALKTETSSKYQKHYLASLWAESPEDLLAIQEITNQGLDLFEDTFGFGSKSFVANNYILPEALEVVLKMRNVRSIQTQRGCIRPKIIKEGYSRRYHYTGQRNRSGQVYTVRNVFFEPYSDKTKDWVDLAYASVRNAFICRKPAIICTHRINYVGGISRSHRDRSLGQLRLLLKRIVRNYGEVEFLTSDKLGEIILDS